MTPTQEQAHNAVWDLIRAPDVTLTGNGTRCAQVIEKALLVARTTALHEALAAVEGEAVRQRPDADRCCQATVSSCAAVIRRLLE
jgi:hypothetical protein